MNAEETKRLGLDRPITRRDFGKLMMVGAVAVLVPGCSVITPDQKTSPDPTSPSGNLYIGGNTEDARSAIAGILAEEQKILAK